MILAIFDSVSPARSPISYDPLHRLCLHAYRLDFYQPMTSEPLHFETPIPKAFLQQVKG